MSERLRPSPSDPGYLALRALATDLTAAAQRLHGRSGLRLLDVGCGGKPYRELFAGPVAEHVGVDAFPGPGVDVVAPAEALPFRDGEFDVVLCTQVLEHVEAPALVVAEMARVCGPGGLVLASTHGVFVYHPDPPESGRDYWRWTHSGLRKLFDDNAEWASIEIAHELNVLGTIGYVLAQYADTGLKRVAGGRGRAPGVAALNRAFAALDARWPGRARDERPGSLVSNYLVTATR